MIFEIKKMIWIHHYDFKMHSCDWFCLGWFCYEVSLSMGNVWLENLYIRICCGKDDKCMQHFNWENLKGQGHLETVVHGMIILKWTEIDCGNLDIVYLTYDRDCLWIFVNMVLKLWVSLKVHNGWVTWVLRRDFPVWS